MDLKTNGEVIFITILLPFHYLISLETASTQKSEAFLSRILLRNVNAVFTGTYPQNYNLVLEKNIQKIFVSVFI